MSRCFTIETNKSSFGYVDPDKKGAGICGDSPRRQTNRLRGKRYCGVETHIHHPNNVSKITLHVDILFKRKIVNLLYKFMNCLDTVIGTIVFLFEARQG